MIENKFIRDAINAFAVKEYIFNRLKKVGLSDVILQKTPLGEKIIIKTSRPGLVVGRKGSNIQMLTKELKEKFNLENPQIEIEEVTNYYLDPGIVAEIIANYFERYGTKGFKGIAHRCLQDVMRAGARGVEIKISGLVPSQRAKTWRFRAGYMKKSGDIAMHYVKKAHRVAQLKRCVIGVSVTILPPDVRLPDDIIIKEEKQIQTEPKEEEPAQAAEKGSSEVKEEKESKTPEEENKEEKKESEAKSNKKTNKKKKKSKRSGKKNKSAKGKQK